ncbi:unnamed protein product [Echinostoma caproni]|uniref:BRO1 domain-containing protein n=1 Tax=Echinostoma caproni TaxID=27848 RepID=A0A183AWH1_9TREM|nr:unnamed protein product [Echinostoma caproni]
MTDPALDPEAIHNDFQQYLSLLMGFITPPENSKDTVSKLRRLITFKWTDSVLPKGSPPVMEPDAMFEVCSMCFLLALWHTKHAAKISAKEEVSQEEAKEVYMSLRQAAGIFKLLRDKYAPNMLAPAQPGHDLYVDVLEAYISQCLAEAQEVTVARAIELKHEPSLIAALSKETSKAYEHACNLAIDDVLQNALLNVANTDVELPLGVVG